MTYEEAQIIDYLKGSPDEFVARKEIARKAVNRRVFDEDPHWADAALRSLVDTKALEQNESGAYRIKKFEG